MKAALIILPILIIGAVIGAGMTGMVEIPGLTPPKKKVAAKKEEKEAPPKKAKAKPEPAPPLNKKDKPKKPAEPEIKMDYVAGDKKLAKLWNELDPETLGKIIEKWKDPELAAVLQKMDSSSVAILLANMKPERASRLSREIRKQASVVKG